MTVYVTGDIHGGVDMQKLRDWDLGDGLTSDDYLIIAGDFGFPWDFSAEECADIAWLESRPYTVLFVDGNHERFDHWSERPMELWHGGLTQRLSDTSPIRRLTRGEVFELDGSTIFTMGGATSVDKEYRIPYSSWWPQELPDERNFEEARAKLDSVGWKGRLCDHPYLLHAHAFAHALPGTWLELSRCRSTHHVFRRAGGPPGLQALVLRAFSS